jgi:hypothetical protein
VKRAHRRHQRDVATLRADLANVAAYLRHRPQKRRADRDGRMLWRRVRHLTDVGTPRVSDGAPLDGDLP